MISLHEVALRRAAVLAVIGETLPGPVVREIAAQLPPDISALMPASSIGDQPPLAGQRP